MDWKDLKDAVSRVAPLAGTLIGGPAGAAVGAIISSTLGVSNDPSEVEQALKKDPQAAIKLKEIESTRQVELQRLLVQAEGARLAAQTAEVQAVTADRSNARDNAVKGGTAKPLFWLSVLLLLVCLGCESAVLFLGYPHTVPDIVVGRVLGLLDAVAMMVLSFWYGTNSSSERKTELLAQSMPAEPGVK